MGKKRKDKPDAEGEISDLCRLSSSPGVPRQTTDAEKQHFGAIFEKLREPGNSGSRQSNKTSIEDEEKDSFGERIHSFLTSYPFGKDNIELTFSCSLSSRQRKEVHRIAELVGGLDHQSFGLNRSKRQITVSVPFERLVESSGTILEYYSLKGGSIYFQGPCVDLAGASGDVSPEYIEKRKERDGNDHSHITLLHATTIAQLSEASGKSIEEMTQKAFELFCKCPDDWQDLGLGSVQDKKNENEAFFRVVSWTAAAQVREALGAPPHDFHISVGFKQNDIHGVDKGVSTLKNATSPDTAGEGGEAGKANSSRSRGGGGEKETEEENKTDET